MSPSPDIKETEVSIPVKEYKHGDAPVKPASSRADRIASEKLEDFPLPTGREEEWRFTPLARFNTLIDENAYTSISPTQKLSDNNTDSDFEQDQPEKQEKNLLICLKVDPSFSKSGYSNESVSSDFGKCTKNTDFYSLNKISGYLEFLKDRGVSVTQRTISSEQKPISEIGLPSDRLGLLALLQANTELKVEIADNADIADPIHLNITCNNEQAQAIRIKVIAGKNSNSTVIFTHEGSGNLAENVEVEILEQANLTLVTTQEWDEKATHASNHRVKVGQQANLKHIVLSFGADAVRICPDVEISGEGGECNILGVYFTDAEQHHEHRVYVDHKAPKCKSRVTYKGALQGKNAHSVWVGDVLIRDTATGTDSYEINRNLVLTKGALADSVPNLEIETGQIEGAGHASATGRFDDEQIFYLMSRGLEEAVARRLVVLGFFREIVTQVGINAVEEHIMEIIQRELEVNAI